MGGGGGRWDIRSGPEALRTDCGESGAEEKAEELEPRPVEERGPAGGICGEVQQLSFLRQGHMGLVIPLVTCEW